MKNIYKLQNEWSNFFISAGALPPSPEELIASENKFAYCKTNNNKFKNKIGYICSISKKYFIITINKFAEGGCKLVFNSRNYTNNTDNIINICKVNTNKINYIKIKNEKEKIRKQNNFKSLLEKFNNANIFNPQTHPYAVRKQLSHFEHLKRIDKNTIAFLIKDIESNVKAIQTIDASGKIKLIFGNKKGNFAKIGCDLSEAKTFYICEGMATADAINKILYNINENKFCIIIALDIFNMEEVAKNIRKKFEKKKIVLLPDNDYKKLPNKDNVGLVRGYKIALELNLLINHTTEKFAGSDWNDALQENYTEAIENFKNIHQYSKFQLLCKILENSSNLTDKNKINTILYKTIKNIYNYEFCYRNENNILDELKNSIKHLNLNINPILKEVKNKIFAKYLREKSISTECRRIKNKNFTIHYEPLKVSCIQEAIPCIETFKLSCKMPIIFINKGSMGTGKTKNFIKPYFINATKQKNNPIIINPTRSLTRKMARDLDAIHYMEYDESLKNDNPLATTINSLNKLIKLNNRKEIFIEEYSQICNVFTDINGTVRNENKLNLYKTMFHLINNSKYVYIADADINQIHINNIIKELQNFYGDKKAECMICPIVVDKKDKEVRYNIYKDKDENFRNKIVLDKMYKKAQLNEKIYITSDSKNLLKVACKKFDKLNKKIFFINSENSTNTEQKNFLESPDKYLFDNKIDILLTTPAIQSGLSIEKYEFDNYCGLYQGIVKPSIFRQMMHRTRNAKEFHISFRNYRKELSTKQTDTNELIKSYYTQFTKIAFDYACESFFDKKTNSLRIGDNIVIDNDNINIRLNKFLNFDRYVADLRTLKTQQEANRQLSFIIQSIADGVNINFIENDIEDKQKKKIRKEYKKIKENIKKTETETILKAETLTAPEYNFKKRFKNLNEQDMGEIKKYDISKALYKKEITEKDVEFYDKKGEYKLNNYKLFKKYINDGIEKIQKREIENCLIEGVSRLDLKQQTVQLKLLDVMFKSLKLDIETFKGSFTSKEADVFANSLNNEMFDNFIIHKLKLVNSKNVSSVRIVNKIISKLLGLTVCKKQVRKNKNREWIYSIDDKSIEIMELAYKNYLEHKELIKQNELTEVERVMSKYKKRHTKNNIIYNI